MINQSISSLLSLILCFFFSFATAQEQNYSPPRCLQALNSSPQARLQKAEALITSVIYSKQPFTYKQAIEYIQLILPEGDLKKDLLTGSEELLDSPGMQKKRGWKTMPVKTQSEAFARVLLAVRATSESKLFSLGFKNLYFRSSAQYLNSFLSVGGQRIKTENDLYLLSKDFLDIQLPENSPLKNSLHKWGRIFLNFLWYNDFRVARSLGLTPELSESIASGSPFDLTLELHNRYANEVKIHWYLKHLRNIHLAAVLASVALIAPPFAGGYFNQYELEHLGHEEFNPQIQQRVESILQNAQTKLIELLKQEINRDQTELLKPEEEAFFKDLENQVRDNNKVP